MISEIKQRITQLNNGEVPNGYKKTEFGVFPCDWVTDKRLKDIGTFGKGKGLPGGKMISEGVPCVGYGDIYMKYNNFHFEKAESFVDEETASESQPIQKGTLLFTGTGETAEEIGKCVCYNGDETIYAGGDIITFISNEVKPLFLAYQQYQDFSLRNKASFGQGHSVVHIHADNLEKLNVAYPKSADEQSKIAEILMKWDEAIELYNQYIEKLKQLKSIWLKKMFPKKGERVPEWRFKGFTDAWEQRKLGELVDVCSGRDYKHLSEGTIPVYGTGGYMLSVNDALSYDRDAIGIGRKGTIDKPYILKAPFWTVDTLFYAIPREKVDLNFAFDIFQNIDWKKKDESTGVPSLSKTAINDIDVLEPKHGEQQTIGQFFAGIDHLITLHQCKVEKIKAQQKVLQKYLLNGIVRV